MGTVTAPQMVSRVAFSILLPPTKPFVFPSFVLAYAHGANDTNVDDALQGWMNNPTGLLGWRETVQESANVQDKVMNRL